MPIRNLILTILLVAGLTTSSSADRPYLETALGAAKWIRASAVRSDRGLAWPSDPHDPKSVNTGLYSGTPGVILFLLEAHRASGDKSLLKDARAGADYLIATLDEQKESGLYTGLAGIGMTLTETYKMTRDEKYRAAARRCVQMIQSRARKAGGGIEWNDSTDIISGTSGIGLFLIYAARELNEPSARETATVAARHLIELGKRETGGINWMMSPTFPRSMPNFSHGTGGVAYFLATLFQETKDKEFLNAALQGGNYLVSIADTAGDGCLIFHHEPDGKDLYYLGWCHGPPGTARLFYRLYQVTGDSKWLDWTKRSAKSLMESGIPEKRTPGFWNNVSICCGSAAVAGFMLDLYRVTKQREYLDFAKRVTTDLLARATRDASGVRWVQAEHRVKPELLVAQTGFMQGAAGMGFFLAQYDSLERGKKERITLPDSPF